jgi:hypothetical protein
VTELDVRCVGNCTLEGENRLSGRNRDDRTGRESLPEGTNIDVGASFWSMRLGILVNF